MIRSRLHVPQKCSDMDVMKLIWPWKPGILKACGEKASQSEGTAEPERPSPPTSGNPLFPEEPNTGGTRHSVTEDWDLRCLSPGPVPNLGSAQVLLGQLLQRWPLLPDGVQHLLVADHLLEVPFIACI